MSEEQDSWLELGFFIGDHQLTTTYTRSLNTFALFCLASMPERGDLTYSSLDVQDSIQVKQLKLG